MKAYTRTVRAVRMPDLTHAAFERFKPVATTVPAACRQRPQLGCDERGVQARTGTRHRPRQCESLPRLAQAESRW
jgi:hypothetical protein